MMLGRNDPCHCGSGKKYKKCHLDEDNKRLSNKNKSLIELAVEHKEEIPEEHLKPSKERNLFKSKIFDTRKNKLYLRCVAPVSPPCKNQSIASHSISKFNFLLKLCDPTNHVMVFERKKFKLEQKPFSKVVKMGVNEATVFYSLCAKHDAFIFNEVDNVDSIQTEKQMFLLSYRSVLRELYAKTVEYKCANMLIQEIEKMDGKRNYFDEFKAYTHGCYMAQVDMKKFKETYDENFNSGNFSKDLRFIFRKVKRLPFAVAGFFSPPYDLKGGELTRSADPFEPYPALTLDVVPQSQGTIVVIGVHRYHEKRLKKILDQIENTKLEEFPSMIWELALRGSENLVISPPWWEKLESVEKDLVEVVFNNTNHLANGWKPFPSKARFF